MSEYTIRDATQEDVLDIVLAVKQFCKEIPHPAWSKINTNKINQIVTSLIDHESGFVKLIDFDGRLQHTGTSCTDSAYRMVINFVYS